MKGIDVASSTKDASSDCVDIVEDERTADVTSGQLQGGGGDEGVGGDDGDDLGAAGGDGDGGRQRAAQRGLDSRPDGERRDDAGTSGVSQLRPPAPLSPRVEIRRRQPSPPCQDDSIPVPSEIHATPGASVPHATPSVSHATTADVHAVPGPSGLHTTAVTSIHEPLDAAASPTNSTSARTVCESESPPPLPKPCRRRPNAPSPSLVLQTQQFRKKFITLLDTLGSSVGFPPIQIIPELDESVVSILSEVDEPADAEDELLKLEVPAEQRNNFVKESRISRRFETIQNEYELSESRLFRAGNPVCVLCDTHCKSVIKRCGNDDLSFVGKLSQPCSIDKHRALENRIQASPRPSDLFGSPELAVSVGLLSGGGDEVPSTQPLSPPPQTTGSLKSDSSSPLRGVVSKTPPHSLPDDLSSGSPSKSSLKSLPMSPRLTSPPKALFTSSPSKGFFPLPPAPPLPPKPAPRPWTTYGSKIASPPPPKSRVSMTPSPTKSSSAETPKTSPTKSSPVKTPKTSPTKSSPTKTPKQSPSKSSSRKPPSSPVPSKSRSPPSKTTVSMTPSPSLPRSSLPSPKKSPTSPAPSTSSSLPQTTTQQPDEPLESICARIATLLSCCCSMGMKLRCIEGNDGSNNSYFLLENVGGDKDAATEKQEELNFYDDTGRAVSVVVEKNLRAIDLTQLLAVKNRVRKDYCWSIVEHWKEIGVERALEDHEDVLSIHRQTEAGGKRFIFRRYDNKYEFFTKPEEYFPPDMIDLRPAREGYLNPEKDPVDLEIVLTTAQEFPVIFSQVNLREEKNRNSWVKTFLLLTGTKILMSSKVQVVARFLRSWRETSPSYRELDGGDGPLDDRDDGLDQYVAGGEGNNEELEVLADLKDYEVYTSLNAKNQLRGPTEFGVVLRKTSEEDFTDSVVLSFDKGKDRVCWVTAMRLAKYGKLIRENYKAFKNKQDSLPPSGSTGNLNVDENYRSRVPMDFTGKVGRIVEDPREAKEIADYEGSTWIHKLHVRCRPSAINGILLEYGEDDKSHEGQPWYHRNMTREQATALLTNFTQQEGVFVVRGSRSAPGGNVLSVRTKDKVIHVPILMIEDTVDKVMCYTIDSGLTRFYDICQLVEFYRLNSGSLPNRLTNHIVQKPRAAAPPQ